MVLLAVCAPVAIGLFLVLMERLEAALFPAGERAGVQPPAGVVVPADGGAVGEVSASEVAVVRPRAAA